jgi:serine/threonine protein kinase
MSDTSSAPAALPTDPPMPTRIGKYPVLARLGAGATSDVYLALDEFRDRSVAIKLLRPWVTGDTVDEHFRSRFFAAEAALVGRLRHPNVVRIYDAVDTPGEQYLVMEYVAGETLRRYCRPDSLLSLDLVVEIGFKCAMALGYMARQGLIHRDVKPANIMAVLHEDAVIDVKIADFGSVLNMASDRTQLLQVGSLAYISPEQLDGNAVDARADMYSLAAVLYHLVSGRLPFDADSHRALMHQIFNATPPSLVGLRAGVPPRMDEILQRALAKDPNQRHSTWDEFARDWSALVTEGEIPCGLLQDLLDSERFILLRSLEFFEEFGDIELWEVVHRAVWQRHQFGAALFRKGEEGNTFHIVAQGQVNVYRDGVRVGQLRAGTTVGEMAYLAPSPDLRIHSADVIVTEPTTCISFTPQSLGQLSVPTRHLFDRAFIRVLVRRLHVAHEALAHPRRIL